LETDIKEKLENLAVVTVYGPDLNQRRCVDHPESQPLGGPALPHADCHRHGDVDTHPFTLPYRRTGDSYADTDIAWIK
jgi:hypothetical protein